MRHLLHTSLTRLLTAALSGALMLGLFSAAEAQQNPTPAPPQKKSVLIMNATAHIGNGQVIENSLVGFREGKIDLVADARTARVSITAYDTVIIADSKHLYPGFIAGNTTLGLHEIDAVRAQDDLAEVGSFKPGVRSAIAYNTDSEIIPTVRSNGVLIGQITPRGGTVSGTSSVMQFDAWNWEDALVREDDGVHLNWPEVVHRHRKKSAVRVERVKSYDQQRREIAIFFAEARAYAESSPPVTEMRYEALRGIFSGTATLYVHADHIQAIREALAFKREMNIPEMVIVGGYDAHHAAGEMKEADVAVMLRRVHALPVYDSDDPDLPYRLPAMLHEAGVKFCLQNEGDMERMGLRNLPFYAGTAVAYGLPYEEAVRSITLAPAEILGIAERCGSIETGKDATLILSDGDALDMRTNRILYAFIEGRRIGLGSKQTQLYEKYRRKYREQ
jgi:imidazolonepropionase-like amidohydrolase